MSSVTHSYLIGKDVFKEIIKMTNEINYCDQIKNTIDYILKDIYKLHLLINFIPTTTLTLFGYNYYTGINIINTVIPMNRSLQINNTIKFIVDIYKIPNSPNSRVKKPKKLIFTADKRMTHSGRIKEININILLVLLSNNF